MYITLDDRIRNELAFLSNALKDSSLYLYCKRIDVLRVELENRIYKNDTKKGKRHGKRTNRTRTGS